MSEKIKIPKSVKKTMERLSKQHIGTCCENGQCVCQLFSKIMPPLREPQYLGTIDMKKDKHNLKERFMEMFKKYKQ